VVTSNRRHNTVSLTIAAIHAVLIAVSNKLSYHAYSAVTFADLVIDLTVVLANVYREIC
jgi:hypothetical protein